MKRAGLFSVLSLAISLLVLGAARADLQQPASPADRFEVSDVMIPMRDGKRLNTKIFTPRLRQGSGAAGSGSEPLPIIFKRTPYGIQGAAGNFNAYYRAMAEDGYIFVHQDIRGKFGSEGDFVMQRPAAGSGDQKAIDEGTDTYDTIDWLIKNVPQQQRPRRHARHVVRRLDHDHGRDRAASRAEGDLAAGLARRHVAGRRLPPQRRVSGSATASSTRAMMESGKDVQHFAFDRYDTYDWYLTLGPLVERQLEVLQRQDPDLERFRRTSGLRRVLEAADDDPAPEQREGADTERRAAGGIRKTSTGPCASTRRSSARHQAT